MAGQAFRGLRSSARTDGAYFQRVQGGDAPRVADTLVANPPAYLAELAVMNSGSARLLLSSTSRGASFFIGPDMSDKFEQSGRIILRAEGDALALAAPGSSDQQEPYIWSPPNRDRMLAWIAAFHAADRALADIWFDDGADPMAMPEVDDLAWNVGQPIDVTLPAVTGDAFDPVYAITPALPAGAVFHAEAHRIDGSVSEAAAPRQYTYTATEAGGAVIRRRFMLGARVPPVAAPSAASSSPGPVVDLFTVRLADGAVERHTTGPEGSDSVMYGGHEYRPLPIALDGAGYGSSGASVRPTLRVSLLDRTAAPAGWHGATVERVRTLERYLDGSPAADPQRHWPRESWVVDRLSSRGREEVVWQLSSPLDLEPAMIPRRQVLRDVCQWAYRRRVGNAWVNPSSADGCPYRGNSYWNADDEPVADPARDACSRRLSGCKLRFGENGALPFGGFAGVSQLRR